MQTSGSNGEHKHSEIEHFLTLNERIIAFWLQALLQSILVLNPHLFLVQWLGYK